MTLARTMRSMPAMPMADSRPPMVVGIRHTSSATSTVSVTTEPVPALVDRVLRERRQRGGGQQEHQRHHGEQDGERDLVRRARALRAFDHRDHAIEEAFAFAARDAHHEPVGQHARAARDRGEVAAGFAQHRRGFARDRALVDRSHAFDDFAVGGNDVVGLDQHEVAARQRAGLDGLMFAAIAADDASWRARAGASSASVAACALPRPFGDGLGEVGEQHRQPQPGGDGEHEAGMARIARRAERGREPDERREDAADVHHEHHGIAELHARIELREGVAHAPHDRPVRKCSTPARAQWHSCSASADHLQMLDDRAQRQRGHEGQRADQQHHADQHRR